MMRWALPGWVLALGTLVLGGCAGARYQVRADTLRYPVSLSPVLLGPDGQPVYVTEDLLEVGTFRVEQTHLGFFYSASGAAFDISDIVNREIEAKNGDGVVTLAIDNSGCGTNMLFPLTLLPFYPGCQVSVISGSVVRYVPSQTARNP